MLTDQEKRLNSRFGNKTIFSSVVLIMNGAKPAIIFRQIAVAAL
ncbi:hypothetical protein [Boudabousia tangfeifanii]|nr:hypothetical protein [Boudabousia tangfeifanii]